MKISEISFTGAYKEAFVKRDEDIKVKNELNQARPFLRQIAYSMPKEKDLYVRAGKDKEGNSCLQAFYMDKDYEKKLLAKSYGNEFTTGLSFTEKVLSGIKKHYPEIYLYTLTNFITKLSKIDNEKINSKYLNEENADLFNKLYPQEINC